ncbi:MAG: hypothetical protein HYZ63_02930 [Candidatus Andersenbacteria bacterium]|nr:hypothetical protein [Candidatus Andersenbacteria bacterium]
MKKRPIYIVGWVATGIALSIGIVLYTTLSTWFYWSLLPTTGNIAISAESGRHLGSFIALADSAALPAEHVMMYTRVASRLAYTDGPNGQFLIMLPKLLLHGQAKEMVIKEGWQYQKFGIMLIAKRGTGSEELGAKTQVSSIVRAFWLPWQQLLWHGQAFRPPVVIVAKPDAINGLKNGLVATSQYQEGGVYAKITFTYPATPEFSEIQHINKATADNNTPYNFLALQRQMLAYIPTRQKNTLLHSIISQIGFTKTNDRLVKEVADMPSITLYQNAGHASLGSQENAEVFMKTARAWVESEDAYNYPQRRAFKLPDGTLGYETRPSKPDSNWVNTDNNCQYFNGKEKTWWVCSANGKAVLSNTQAAASQAISHQQTGYQQLHLAQLKGEKAEIGIEMVDIKGKENSIEIYIK